MNWVDGDILDFERGVICNVVNPDGIMGAGLAGGHWPLIERMIQEITPSAIIVRYNKGQ